MVLSLAHAKFMPAQALKALTSGNPNSRLIYIPKIWLRHERIPHFAEFHFHAWEVSHVFI